MTATNCFELDPRHAMALVDSLTKRELEVCKMLAFGERTKTIARKSGRLSTKTIETQRVSIYKKFGGLGVARVWFCAAVFREGATNERA